MAGVCGQRPADCFLENRAKPFVTPVRAKSFYPTVPTRNHRLFEDYVQNEKIAFAMALSCK